MCTMIKLQYFSSNLNSSWYVKKFLQSFQRILIHPSLELMISHLRKSLGFPSRDNHSLTLLTKALFIDIALNNFIAQLQKNTSLLGVDQPLSAHFFSLFSLISRYLGLLLGLGLGFS